MSIILPQVTTVKITKKNIEHYKLKGYNIQLRDMAEVNVLDLSKGNKNLIICECDYCNKIIERSNKRLFCDYKQTTACNDCKILKSKETCLKKYGVDNPWKSDIVKNKIKQTMINNYGVDNYSKTEEFKVKSEKTFMNKYGVKNPMQVDEIKNRALCNARKTMYREGNAPCSKQQKHINNLIKGELNYPISRCSLDIAFPNEMIYIEYDGGGHGWWVKSNLSENKVKLLDIKRKMFLQKLGWKIIRIISRKDKLPNDNIILELINKSKNYLLNSNHTWIEIDIDNSTYKCAEENIIIDLGNLINTKRRDKSE